MIQSPMNPVRKYLVQHNSIFVLVLSILIGVFVTYLAYDVVGRTDIIFIIPVAAFVVMVYLKMKGLKQRLVGGLIIFLVVGILAAALTSVTYYNTEHPMSYNLPNGEIATLSVSPFGGHSQPYNFSLEVTNVTAPSLFSASFGLTASGFNVQHYNFSEMNFVIENSNTVLLYKHVSNLPAGVYTYNFTIANGTSTPIVVGANGPANSGSQGLFTFVLFGFVFLYLVPMELILLAMVFFQRSVENSRKYRAEIESRYKKQ